MTATMRDMFKAGVHYGHRTRYWNPKMSPYIYGSRNQIHIINLDHSHQMYSDAINYLSRVAASNGKILFVGTKRAAQDIIREQAERCGMPYVNHRWLGGMLTNYKTVRQSIARLKELEQMQASGAFSRMIKKEALQLSRELEKLERSLGGIKNINGLPDAIFIVDVGNEKIAVAEANKLRIPVIGIVDTNNNPDNIDYVIPGNDDSMSAIELYAKGIADMVLDSKQSKTTANRDKGEYVEVKDDLPVEKVASSGDIAEDNA